MERRPITKEQAVPDDLPEIEEPLHLKYRPRKLGHVFGQDLVTDSLKAVVASKNPSHAFLFVGPSGCGKTTLARIMAKSFNCASNNILEIDAASNSGIDAMKSIVSTFQYQGFGDSPNRAIIIDECHAISKQAWQSLLKPIEEPPAHVFIFLCTTESGKVPETILTRCSQYQLKSLKFDDLMDLLEEVAKDEDLRTPQAILELVARSCGGSARQALVMLEQVKDCEHEDDAGRLLEAPESSAEVIDLCRALVSGKLDWQGLVTTLKLIPDMNPESVRIVMVNYLAAVAMGSKTEASAIRILNMLASFSQPFNASDKLAPLLLAFGNHVFK